MRAKLLSKAILTQLESTHKLIPDEKMHGTLVGFPLMHHSFVFKVGDSIARRIGGDYLTTSPVQSIIEENSNKLIFKTVNSTYQLEVLDEDKEKKK